MTVRLSLVDVIEIHARVCPERLELVRQDVLESALGEPFATWDGIDLYPTVIEKAARLLYGITRAQAFLSGNKRTAWVAFVTMLCSNGLEVRHLEAMDLADAIADIGEREEDRTALVGWCISLVV